MCLAAGKPKIPPMEALYAEINQLNHSGRKDYSHVSPVLYHTISRNLDFYNFKTVEEWKAFKIFEVAYKATLFQIECGEELATPPNPETLLPQPFQEKREPTEAEKEKANEVMKNLLSMFDEPEVKPLTPAEIADNERLESLR